MSTTDKLDICHKTLRVCAVVAIVSAFCITYRKGATDAIEDFYTLTRDTKFSDIADDLERRANEGLSCYA